MNTKTKVILLAAIVSSGLAAIFASGQVALAGEGSEKKNADPDIAIPLKES